MDNSEAIKRELSQGLTKEHKSWLWSYDIAKEDFILSDHLIIEKYLLWGQKKDWARIKQAFELELIKDVWLNNLVPSGMYEEKHRRIARYFFNICQPAKYLRDARDKHLENALAGINSKTFLCHSSKKIWRTHRVY